MANEIAPKSIVQNTKNGKFYAVAYAVSFCRVAAGQVELVNGVWQNVAGWKAVMLNPEFLTVVREGGAL